ncbi:hypothetical protein OC25_10295 [Pedobacter kyungheensis]|uniref:Uncharacterized protein n=2 Tax=Pedobacter kyungheensis TaxID=1069985 RepID=A0A0C1DA67_9SPHI|nr:hypothetical protein OC25_10295 [Pedobacter kyungheensis]
MTTVYSKSKGKIDVPLKENYTVTYQVGFEENLKADVAYTDESGKQSKLENISGEWEKQVTLKTGTHVELKTLAKAKTKSRATYKILVDGKVVAEYIQTGKRLSYMLAFDLP